MNEKQIPFKKCIVCFYNDHMTLAEAAVYNFACRVSHQSGWFKFPARKLAVHCHIGKSTANRAVKSLIAKGWFQVIKAAHKEYGINVPDEVRPISHDEFKKRYPEQCQKVIEAIALAYSIIDKDVAAAKQRLTNGSKAEKPVPLQGQGSNAADSVPEGESVPYRESLSQIDPSLSHRDKACPTQEKPVPPQGRNIKAIYKPISNRTTNQSVNEVHTICSNKYTTNDSQVDSYAVRSSGLVCEVKDTDHRQAVKSVPSLGPCRFCTEPTSFLKVNGVVMCKPCFEAKAYEKQLCETA